MRPEKLLVQAFGPYAGAQMFDFQALGERSLFLIWGPTGAGKSTILDAICYALYGQSSGGERRPEQMRSHHADPGVLTEVTFEFSLGAARYRVLRRPEQPRKKKRGEGLTTARAAAELYRLEPDGEKLLAHRVAQVDDALEAIVGFRVEQFRQVVVLPQGQFRRLLSADSAERQEILAHLFQTEAYRRIQEALASERTEIEQRAQTLTSQTEALCEQQGVSSLKGLESSLVELDAKIAKESTDLDALRRVERQRQHAFDRARDLASRFAELRAAQEERERLETQKDAFAEHRSRLERARNAEGLRDLEAELVKQRETADLETSRLRSADAELEQASAEQRQAAAAAQAEEAKEPERQRVRQERQRLGELTDRVAAAERTRGELVALDSEDARAREVLRSRTVALERARSLLDRLAEERESVARRCAQHEALSLELDARRRALQEAELAESLRIELDAWRQRRETRVAEREHRQAALVNAQADLEAFEQAWREGQSALLAAGLVDGQPCPVCGSLEHPRPAERCSDAPDEADIERRRHEVARLHDEWVRLNEEIHELDRRMAALRGRMEEVTADARQQAPGVEIKGLEERVAEAEQRLGDARAAAERLPELDEKLSAGRESVEALGREVAESDAAVRQSELARASQRAVLAEQEKGIPQALRPAGALQRAIERAGARLAELTRAQEQTRVQKQAADEALAVARQRAAGLQESVDKARGRLAELQAVFAARLSRAGFADESHFRAARMEPQQIEQLDTQVQEYQANRRAAGKRLQQAQEATAQEASPDLEGFQAQLEAIRDEVARANRSLGDLQGARKNLFETLQQVQRRERTVAELERRFGVVGELSRVACAKEMSFERYVLSALLDDVLLAASLRLQVMSRRRYDLRRDRQLRDRRRVGGLDLVVFDAFTGEERPVATLSGGEGFLAALSLALGLSDVVQAHAGGIRLDTVFVDEGFGSLDSEALDLALGTLIELNLEGRLVGVISHVAELKERIETRLEVVPSPQGSIARPEPPAPPAAT